MCSLPERWQKKTAVGRRARLLLRRVVAAGVHGARLRRVPDRSRARRHDGIDKARELVDEGWSIVVFPEGTRSQDGHMQRFRHGASRLALELGVGVVPIAIVGAYQAMPKGRWWPRQGRPGRHDALRRADRTRRKARRTSAVRADAAGGDGAVRRGPDRLVRCDSRGPSAGRRRRSPARRARPGAARGRARGRCPRARPARRTWE